MTSARRVVTGKDTDGSSAVMLDSFVEFAGAQGGPRIAVLWEIVPDGQWWSSVDPGGYAQLPEPGRVRLVQLVLPPNSERSDELVIPMHSTPTIDLLFVAQGSAELVLDAGPTLLQLGDCLVMQGDVHGWRNPGEVDCVLIAAMAGSVK